MKKKTPVQSLLDRSSIDFSGLFVPRNVGFASVSSFPSFPANIYERELTCSPLHITNGYHLDRCRYISSCFCKGTVCSRAIVLVYMVIWNGSCLSHIDGLSQRVHAGWALLRSIFGKGYGVLVDEKQMIWNFTLRDSKRKRQRTSKLHREYCNWLRGR